MRVDKAKNIKALKKELLKKPLQTEDELAEKLWVNRKTINRLKQEMPEIVTDAKDRDILDITDEDKFIIQMSQAISRQSLWEIVNKIAEDPDFKIELRDAKTASEIAKESTARFTIFRWSATDEQWGLKETVTIEI